MEDDDMRQIVSAIESRPVYLVPSLPLFVMIGEEVFGEGDDKILVVQAFPVVGLQRGPDGSFWPISLCGSGYVRTWDETWQEHHPELHVATAEAVKDQEIMGEILEVAQRHREQTARAARMQIERRDAQRGPGATKGSQEIRAACCSCGAEAIKVADRPPADDSSDFVWKVRMRAALDCKCEVKTAMIAPPERTAS